MRSNKNKKTIYSNSVRGTQRFTKPSRTNGAANIQINSETAIPKLKILSEKYIGITNPHGFLTNLRQALGLVDSEGASKYGVVKVINSDGNSSYISLRITNHNCNAENYIYHCANFQLNVSILVRKNFKKNTFKPHKDVVLEEYVYYGKRMAKVENPLSKIINGIVEFLKTGKYVDTTGIAFKNTSP